MSGLGCPKCASPLLIVLDSRQGDGKRLRRRKCHACGHRFTTMEVPQTERPRPKLGTTEVDNPYFAPEHREGRTNPKTIPGVINIHESAVETLYAKRLLNSAQKRAADKFRGYWETMGGKGASAIDYSKDVVDGGKSPQDISDHQWQAGEELRRCFEKLKARDYDLVAKVCGQGFGLAEVGATKRQRHTAADNLRAALDDLADMWGLKTRSRASA